MYILRKLGWELNPNDKIVNSIISKIEKYGGQCPCAHPNWIDENGNYTVNIKDTKCPCIDYREHSKCNCGLYLKVKQG